MEDVAKGSPCSMASPTNATQSYLALKRAPAALLLATVVIQRLTVHAPHVWPNLVNIAQYIAL